MVPFIATIVAGATLSLGCGLIVHGTEQEVFVNTIPSGLQIEVDGNPHRTPVTLHLKRKDDHHVVAFGEGGQTVTRTITAEREAKWHVFDVIWFPIVWNVPDLVSGADKKLSPQRLTITVPRAQDTE